MTTDVLAPVNGKFQRMTPKTSVSGKDHAQNEQVHARSTGRAALQRRSGNAWPFAFRAPQKFEKSTARSLERANDAPAI
ncbi:MAG: hypothetical protein EOS13_26740 [Mesorhizobium sp.]|nr:MAG: hypothetical protein EOS13_26740 [Mesorhizobium sp.]